MTARPVSSAVALVFVTVTVWALLVAPTPVVEKLSCAGCNCTEPAAPPIPVRITVAVFKVDEPTVSVPPAVPFAVGVNTTPVVQLAPAARLVVQVFCVRLKGAVTVSVSPAALRLLALLTVTVCAALAWPSVASVNVICAGLTFNPDAASPAPLSATVTAFTPSVEEATVSVAAIPPVAAGVKITCTVQLLPLFSAVPQVVAPVEKLPAPGPLIAKPTLAIADPPVLLTVSVSGALAAPACCGGKLKLAGLAVRTGARTPVPLRATVCVFNESATFSVPACVPAAVGTNTTLIEQLEFPASWPPQLLET